jgi:hypothetical protein
MSLVIPAQAGIQKLKSNKHVLYFHNVSDDTILQHFTSFEPYYSVVSTGVRLGGRSEEICFRKVHASFV